MNVFQKVLNTHLHNLNVKRSREILRAMSDHQLEDIGMSREQLYVSKKTLRSAARMKTVMANTTASNNDSVARSHAA